MVKSQAVAQSALLAPIFVPLPRLGIEPQVTLAAYRVAAPPSTSSPRSWRTPLIVVFAARYDKRSGIGTVIALMLPYFIALTIAWTTFFAAWYLLGIPWGPG